MGSNQSTARPIGSLPERLYCSIDLEMLPIHQFKVLNCGHYFCAECLDSWAEQGMLNCPKCRQEEIRSVGNLSGIAAHTGPLFLEEPPDHEDKIEINTMLHAQMVRRSKTIRILRLAAKEVLDIEFASAGVKIGGAAAGLIGTGMVITGSALSLTGVGAIVGVPLALSGAAVGGVGGLTVGGGIIGEALAKNKHLTNANLYLQADYFGSMQLRILIGRASKNEKFAKQMDLRVQDAASMLGVIGRIAKFGTTTAALAKAVAAGVGRGVANAGLHIAGMVISALLIPIDIYQMITSSVKIHRKDKSKVVQEVEALANVLEDELLPLLKEKNYKLVEISRVDDERIRHSMLLAIEENIYDDVIANSNKSVIDIEKNHVVIIDEIGDSIDPINYIKIFNIWNKTDDLDDGYEIVENIGVSDT